MKTLRVNGVLMKTLRVNGVLMKTLRVNGVLMKTLRVNGVLMKTLRVNGVLMKTLRVNGVLMKTLRVNGVLMKTLRCAECRWTSLSSAHSWLSSPLVLTPLIIPNTVLCEAPEEALVQGKHCVGLCTGGVTHDPQNTSHECCFSSRDGKNGWRNRAQAVVYSRLLPPLSTNWRVF